MSRLLTEISGKHDLPLVSAKSLWVNGKEYTCTAAKFWTSIIDEIRTDFPACSSIEISAPTAEAITRLHLTPSLTIDPDLFFTKDLRKAMRDLIAELNILGPPSPVQLRLMDSDREIAACAMPADCVDAETLPYLAVWLLEWAGIPETTWNESLIEGVVIAADPRRHLAYNIPFKMIHKHIREGLYKRLITLTPFVSQSDKSMHIP